MISNASLSVSFPKVGVLEGDSNLSELVEMAKLTSKNHHCNLKLKAGIFIIRVDFLMRLPTFSFLLEMFLSLN